MKKKPSKSKPVKLKSHSKTAKVPTIVWRADTLEKRTHTGELAGIVRGRASVSISVTSSELVEMLRKLDMLDGLEICHGTERIQFARMDFKHIGQ